jgi:hypothetical protein
MRYKDFFIVATGLFEEKKNILHAYRTRGMFVEFGFFYIAQRFVAHCVQRAQRILPSIFNLKTQFNEKQQEVIFFSQSFSRA